MIYADTSVLVSLVLRDSNSERAFDLLEKATKPLFFNSFLKLEVGNALRLFAREKSISEADISIAELTLKNLLLSHRMDFIEPSWERALERARGLSVAHTKQAKCRSLDILHVACAMELQARQFISFDLRQVGLAEKAGLNVIL